MKTFYVTEPDLEFGGNGRHIDIRFGLKATGPLDRGTPSAPAVVRVGVVGDAESVAMFRAWVDKCRIGDLVKEVLALSKMNWNSTHFNHSLPITLAAADDVGSILRHVLGDAPQARYSYYM